MKKQRFSPFMPAILLILAVFTPQCGRIDEGIDQFRLFREQSIYEINNASNLIASGIGSINQTLENLAENLPEEIHKTLSFDVPFIIDAVAGESISAGLCFADAAASKALYLLEVMKSEIITGEPVPLPAPFICHTSIPAIDLNQDYHQRKLPEFTGYNLFLDRRFSAALFTPAGDSVPVQVGRPTNYRVQANLSDFTDAYLKNFKHLTLFYEDQPISSLFVLKEIQTPPVVKFVSPRPTPIVIGAYPVASSWVEDLKFHDDCRVSLSVSFGNNSKRAWAEMTLIVEELVDHKYKTYAVGRSDRNYYYTAPPGWHIKKLDGQTVYDYHKYTDITDQDDVRQTLFGQLTVKAKGSVAGSTTSGVLSFNENVPDIVIESNN